MSEPASTAAAPGVAAPAGVCASCGAASETALVAGANGGLCRACAYRAAVAGTVARRAEVAGDVARARAAADPARAARWRRGAAWTAIVASATGAWFVAPDAVAPFRESSTFAFGDAETSDAPGLREALAGLWAVRAAADEYAAAHRGAGPPSLADLRGAPAACPGCGGAWIFRTAKSVWSVECPRPAAHRRGSVAVMSAWGPPVVASAADGGRR